MSIRARFIEPMLLQQMAKLSEGAQWLYELDGYRAIAFKSAGKVQLRSRNDKDFTTRRPAIALAPSAVPDDTAIDGEVVALDEPGKLLSTFSRTTDHRKPRWSITSSTC